MLFNVFFHCNLFSLEKSSYIAGSHLDKLVKQYIKVLKNFNQNCYYSLLDKEQFIEVLLICRLIFLCCIIPSRQPARRILDITTVLCWLSSRNETPLRVTDAKVNVCRIKPIIPYWLSGLVPAISLVWWFWNV